MFFTIGFVVALLTSIIGAVNDKVYKSQVADNVLRTVFNVACAVCIVSTLEVVVPYIWKTFP